MLHELRTITEAMYLGGVYDQLNLPVLACFEVLARRLQTIVDAYRVVGRAPNWELSRHFAGMTNVNDVVSPELRAHVSRRAKEEAEQLAARKKYEVKEKDDDGDGDGDGGGRGAAGRGRGRGRSRGRGLPPADG